MGRAGPKQRQMLLKTRPKKENSRKNGLRVLYIQNRCAARSQDCDRTQVMRSIALMHAFDRDPCIRTHITAHGARLEAMKARAS
jgi:hypothetical protein